MPARRKPTVVPGRVAPRWGAARTHPVACRIARMRLSAGSRFGHAVYMHRHFKPVRVLDELTVEQHKFLGGVAARIPRLIEAIQAGSAMARFKLGTRRLDDGRHI